jgi:hypothetical protein
MITYLVKSGLCLAILLAFYHLVLEREKMHQFNRFYLLGSVLISFLIPFAIIYVDPTPVILDTSAEVILPISQETTSLDESIPTSSSSISWSQWVLFAYILISSLFAIRFFRNILGLLIKIKTNEIIRYSSAKLVLVKDEILPHTFWNYIFINKEEYAHKKVEKELFTHELTHVTQRHTLDVLIVETLQIVLWFNPFFYPLKKAIQLNHEFLADDKVIASHQDISKYQYLLLDKAAWKNDYYLASNLNYSLTKKRLLMMKTQNSKSTILWKKLAIIPLMGGLIFLFADRVEAQTKKVIKKPVIKEVKEKLNDANKLELKYVDSEATTAQMKRYKSFLKSFEEKKIVKVKVMEEMTHIYNLMSIDQRKTVIDINELVPPPPPKVHEHASENQKEGYKKMIHEYEKVLKAKLKQVKDKQAKEEIQTYLVEVQRMIENMKQIPPNASPEKKQKRLEIKEGLTSPPRKKKVLKEVKQEKGNRPSKPVEVKVIEQKTANAKNKVEFKNSNDHVIVEYKGIDRKIDLKNLKKEEAEYIKKNPKAITFGKTEKGELIEIMEIPTDLVEEQEWKTEFIKGEKIEENENEEFQEEKEIVEIIETKEVLEGMEDEEVEISNFKIVVQKDGNQVRMKCKKGCAWKELEFAVKKNRSQRIDQYGVNSPNKESNSKFEFIVTNKNKKLSLISTKGTAWRALEFSINKDQKRQINQFGVQRF